MEIISDLTPTVNCPIQKTEETTRPVENVALTTKGLQEISFLVQTKKQKKYQNPTIQIITDLNSNCQLPKPGDRRNY